MTTFEELTEQELSTIIGGDNEMNDKSVLDDCLV